MSEATERNLRKSRTGIVTSNKMEKTAVVTITQSYKHPLYKKTIKNTKKLKVHDENNELNIGDKILVEETRRISKDKHWRLVEIIEKAK
ncbi:MAG: 30S ribosomal protein S17 [Clostridiales bacterium]|jgi:small subunit ribosomal protein S17|nr:30S ribosomal protein S17 [Clostridiales bacterium]